MDANKLKTLQDLKYRIKRCCGICLYGRFANSMQLFGCCEAKKYEHQKHSDAKRCLSVYRYGSCDDFSLNPAVLEMLAAQHWSEFLEDK